MTQPATGAPDWQTFTSLHGEALLDGNTVVPAGTTVSLGQWNSSSFNAVHVSIVTNTNGGTFTLLSGETASNVPEDIAGQWVCRPDTRLEVTVPLPRTRLAASATAQAGADWDFTARIALTNTSQDKHHYFGAASMVGVNNIAIAPTAIDTYYPTSLLPGPAHLWVYNSAPGNLLEVDIRERAADGTPNLYIAQYGSTVTRINESFIIPTRLWQVQLHNLGAAGLTYYFSICTHGMQA